MINTDDLALALSAVCQEWLEQKGASPNNTTLEDYMAHGERIYGKKLVVSGIAGSEEEIEEIDEIETDDELFNDEDSINDQLESVKTFEAFSIPAAKKEEKQPEYTILGEEKEPKSNPNFGIGAVKAQEIKKISDFNLIDPPTPKERTIGGNAGVFIDNEKVKGYLNRIEGKDAYVESLEDPMVIKKFSLKDVIKTKKEE